MTIFYNILFLLFSLIYLPVLFYKGKFHGDFLQRFCIFAPETLSRISKAAKILWIHAVSVGEVRAVKPLLEQLQQTMPEISVLLSTTTETGNRLAKQLFGNGITAVYAPVDFSFVTKRFIRLFKPRLFGMMETEIWPNLIASLSQAHVPVVLLNGRISDSSFYGYKAIKLFMRPTLEKIDSFCMQTENDAARMRAIGALSSKVRVTGNMKFDGSFPASRACADSAYILGIKQRIGLAADDDLFVAGSTHSGEEEALIRSYGRVVKEAPRLRLLIAPRHIERTADIERLLKSNGLIPVRATLLSQERHARLKDGMVILLDTIGQLKDLYAAATIVFVGGSLVKKGGHNLVEPAVFGKPILSGPYMHNFRDMASQFLNHKAMITVKDADTLEQALHTLLLDRKKRTAFGENAKRLVAANQGATERSLKVIRKLLYGEAV